MDTTHLATNDYFDTKFNCDAIRVLPGEYYISKNNRLMMTILGSCVAACIWDEKRGIGGINHFMLPGESCSQTDNSPRYGHYAMDILIRQIIQLGGRHEDLVAKVFGGGKIIDRFMSIDIGLSNSDFIIDYLNNASIPILASDFGDIYPRKVYFFPKTGKVLVRKLSIASPIKLELQEANSMIKINNPTNDDTKVSD